MATRKLLPPALPIESVRADPDTVGELDDNAWPATLPCVHQLLWDGLPLSAVTVLVGENGSGKSTIVEAIAQRYGMSAEGGSTGARHSTRPTESPLAQALQLRRGAGASRWGFFLRAETMHGYYTYLEDHPPGPLSGPDQRVMTEPFHVRSHGESFLEIFSRRFSGPGLYVLDEPESALSFSGCLALVGLLAAMPGIGNQQAIVATHSPIIAATPGARIYEIGPGGITPRQWEELELVLNWQAFLRDPGQYLQHVT